MNDRLSPNSLCLVGKSLETRPCSFCSRAHVRRNSLKAFGTSSDIFGYYRTPSKNLVTLRIKMSRLYLKKCLQVYLLRRLVKNVTPENVLESNDTSLWRHTATRLANRTIPPPYQVFLWWENEQAIFWSFHSSDETNKEHLPKPFFKVIRKSALYFLISCFDLLERHKGKCSQTSTESPRLNYIIKFTLWRPSI